MRSDSMTNATQSPARGVELLPCPFCSAALMRMSEHQGYLHPKGNCTLADFHIEADGYSEARWNTRPAQPEDGSGEVKKFANIMRMACDNTRAIRGRAEVAVPTRYWHQLMDLCAALAIKGGE